MAKQVVQNSVVASEATGPCAYGLRIARDLLKDASALSNRTDGAMMELIFALPSPAKEKAFVDFCLTGEVPEEVPNARHHRAAA